MNPASDKAKGNLGAMQTKVGESEQFHYRRFDAGSARSRRLLKALSLSGNIPLGVQGASRPRIGPSPPEQMLDVRT
jgi:hypothetical protein